MNEVKALSSKHKRNDLKQTLLNIGPVYYALFILIVVGILSQPTFTSVRNLRNIIISTTPWAISSIGQTMVLLTAGIDLSLGSIVSLTNSVAALLMKQNPEQIIAIITLCILSGTFVGFINGVGVAYLNLNPFIFTLATGIATQGITLAIMYQPGGLVTERFMKFSRASIGFMPAALFYILIFYFLAWFILKKTPFGLAIYAVGGNESAAHLSGIRSKRVKLAVYTISGLLAALAGLFIASRIGSGDPLVGETLSTDTITASVLGGTSLFGGVGGVMGSLSGSFFIGILSSTLNLNNVSPYLQWIIKGLMLIIALALDLWQKANYRK